MNKKRLGKFIAVSSVFVMSTVTGAIISGCSSCGGKHEHNLSEISAVEPTCTTDGRSAYYVCDGCELVFADADGKTEIDVAQTVKPKLNHNLEHHDADPATCTKPGNIEYWECTRGDGIFSDAEGKNPVETVETTKDHYWGETGHHEQVDPTTESEGVKEYWHCSECNLDYADEYGDKKVTLEELKIEKVSENIDGKLTTEFYPTQNTLTIGGADVLEGGKGLVINAKRAKDGVYLHIVVNYDVEATKQPAGRGKIGLYFNVRNTDNLNLPGGAGVCIEQAMLMELYLTGKVDYHKPYFLMEFETKTNNEGSKTKYTNTWEMFIPHSGFATVNDGAFAEAFEVAEGKTVLKAGYTYMLTAIGAMDATETFEASGESKCDIKDENTWAFWTNQGHGDWGTDQKYYVLGAQGITSDFQRATDTYAVEVNDYSNATVTGLTDTVDYDKKLEGTITVNEGYRLSGIKVNGQVFTFDKAIDANTYTYEIAVSQLTNLKWNDAVLTVEVVVIKLDYQTVTVTLQGVAGGKTQNIANGTDVVIVSDFGDEYSATVEADGKAIFNEVLCQEYFVRIDGYVDGSLTVIKGDASTQATLEYRFAHNAGTRPDLVDLTDMNNANASITLGAQNVNGVDQNAISVQLNLSEEMKTAQAYVLYTTVTVNGDVSESKQNTWLQRFGIRFAAGDVNNTYNNKFVIWWDDLGLNSNPSAIWANDATSCGGGGDRRATFDWLASSVQDGLQLKVVRNGSFVTVSAFNLDDEQWYTLLSGTTSATAENDITFYVSGESFTFSEISFEKLNVVSLKLPSGNTDGIKGHLTSSKGDVFTLSGILTSEDELSIPAGSIAYTEYDNVEIENDLGLITIEGNGIADRNTHSYNHATYILPDAVRDEKEISLSFNVKDINESQETDAWAARRFGIQIGKGAYGLYFWTPNGDEFNIIKLVEGTLDMNTDREGMDIAKANWAAPIIRSTNGLDVRIVRMGEKIVLKLKNADGAWVRIGEMDCPESVETEIKFVGGGDTWEVSSIAVSEYAATAATLKKGETPAGVNIAFGEESLAVGGTVTVTLTGSERYLVSINGNEISVGSTFEISYEEYAAGEIDPEITVSVLKVSDIRVTGGNTHISDGSSVVGSGQSLYDLDAAQLGGKEILGYVRFDSTQNGNPIDPANKITTVKGGLADDDALSDKLRYGDGFGSPIQFKVGDRTNDVCLYLNPNDYGTVTLHIKKGTTQILVYTGTYNGGSHRMTYRLSDNGIVIGDASFELTSTRAYEVKFELDTSGWTENSRDITLYLGGDTECELAAIVALGGEFQKTYNVSVTENPQATIALTDNMTTVKNNGTISGTVTPGSNCKAYYVMVAGTKVLPDSDNRFSVSVESLNLASDVDSVQISLIVSDTSAEISRGELGSNKTIDLSQSELDGKTLLDWNLYKKGECVTKDDATAWATTGIDGLADGGNDYDNPNAITFKTSGSGAAEGTFFCMGGGNYQAHSSVTVKVSKGATQINLYTGSWQSNNSVKFSVKIGDFVLSTQNYVFGNNRRSELVTIAIDTSGWDDNEVRDIVIEIEPATQGYMLAAIAVLGDTVTPAD